MTALDHRPQTTVMTGASSGIGAVFASAGRLNTQAPDPAPALAPASTLTPSSDLVPASPSRRGTTGDERALEGSA